jgi:hypothetical protein
VTTKYGSEGFAGWQHEFARGPQKLVENSRFDHQGLIFAGGGRDFRAVAARAAGESEWCGASDAGKKTAFTAERGDREGSKLATREAPTTFLRVLRNEYS